MLSDMCHHKKEGSDITKKEGSDTTTRRVLIPQMEDFEESRTKV